MPKILAFIETRENKIKASGFETASEAVKIAKELQCECEALLIGENVSGLANELGACGITKIIAAEDARLNMYSTTAYAKIIADVVKQKGFDIILLSATAMGKDLGPRVSGKLDARLASEIIELKVEGGEIIATRPVYAGKALIDIKLTSDIKMFSLRPNVFKSEKTESATPVVEKFTVELSDSDFGSQVKGN